MAGSQLRFVLDTFCPSILLQESKTVACRNASMNATVHGLPARGKSRKQCRLIPSAISSFKSLQLECTLSRSLMCANRTSHIVSVATEAAPDVAQQAVPKTPKLSTQTPDCQFPPLPPIKQTKRVVLVRHGESTWNQAGRIQGSSDFAVLTEKGMMQAETSRQMLADAHFDALFHSPLARSKRTAEIIWDKRTGPVYPVDDLREIDLYAFQGLFKEEGKARFGQQYSMWQKDAANFEIDGHYPVRELWARARSCWDAILKDDSKSALVVAHNAVNQALVATATGLDPVYFRLLLQSNCGVSVLDFTPNKDPEGPPKVSLERLNQTPGPPISGSDGASAGRKAKCRLVLVRHGATESTLKDERPATDEEPMNMLGVMQSRKTAELLLDVTIDTIISSPANRAVSTAAEIQALQENAYCLKEYCEPRFVDLVQLPELNDLDLPAADGSTEELTSTADKGRVSAAWERAGQAWQKVLEVLGKSEAEGDKVVAVVGHELTHVAMICHCLGLTSNYLDKFHLQTGSVSVVDFPDGPSGRGVVRCLNYTAHLGRWSIPVTRPSYTDEEY